MTPNQTKQLKKILKDYRTVVILVADEKKDTASVLAWGSGNQALVMAEKFKHDLLTEKN